MVIAQVPGSMPRSTAVHGVVESFFKSKKYIVPSVVVSPIFAGCVAAVYVSTGAGHFEPARGAKTFVAGGLPESPLGHEDLRSYREELKHEIAGEYPEKSHQNIDKSWEKLQAHAQTAVDAQGHPVLQMQVGDSVLQVGISAGNVLNGHAPPQLVRQLMEARLQSELGGRGSHALAESEIARDWNLLEKTAPDSGEPRLSQSRENPRGNRP